MYKRILVPIDGSPGAQRALAEALALAKDYRATMRLLHVIGLFIATPVAANRKAGDIWRTLHDRGSRLLAEGEALLRTEGIQSESAIVEIGAGRAADAILADAKRWRADLIVIGTHGRRGLSRLALGSEAEKVVRAASVPVLVVHPERKTQRSASPRSVKRAAAGQRRAAR
jgi:nucleotide-binding universal stress UspA family protein